MKQGLTPSHNTQLTDSKGIKSVLRTIKKDLPAWLLISPSLILFIVFVWQPLLSGIILSFYETKGYNAVKFIGLKNYIDVISDSAFLRTLANTFSYTLWSLVIGYLVPIIIALIINEMVHLKPFFKFSVYFPGMVPGVATALMWYFLFDPGDKGILNMLMKFFGLPISQWLQNPKLTIPLIVVTMTWRGFGSTAILYLASLQGVNQELYEVASLDGAGIWKRIRHITIPQISGIIVLLFIMQIIGVFQVMSEPLTMTEGGPNNASMSLMLQAYFYGFRYFQAGRSMAVGAITFVILMSLTIIYFKMKKNADAE